MTGLIVTITMFGGLLCLWAATLVLVYLRGALDTLDWTLSWLQWEQDGGREPDRVKIGWLKLVPWVALSVGMTVFAVTIFLTGGK